MVTPGVERLTVSWDVATDAGGYKVQWKSGAESFDSSRQETAAGTSYTITGLTAGTTYTVRVIATRSNADGQPSLEVTGIPDQVVPPVLDSEGGGGCVIASAGAANDVSKSVLFNLFLLTPVLFLALRRKTIIFLTE